MDDLEMVNFRCRVTSMRRGELEDRYIAMRQTFEDLRRRHDALISEMMDYENCRPQPPILVITTT